MNLDIRFITQGEGSWDVFTPMDVWTNATTVTVSVAGFLILGIIVAFVPKMIKTIQYAVAAYKYEHWRAEAVTFWGIAKLTPGRAASFKRSGRYDLLVDMNEKTLRRMSYEQHGKII